MCCINTTTFMKCIGDCFKSGYTAVYAYCVRLSGYLYCHLQMFQIYRIPEQYTAACPTETISCQHRPSQIGESLGLMIREILQTV
jgi:hypothetical protein